MKTLYTTPHMEVLAFNFNDEGLICASVEEDIPLIDFGDDIIEEGGEL